MILTDNKYIDRKGGLFLEYFNKEGFYGYIHVSLKGNIKFLSTDNCNGVKCDYWEDYTTLECIQAAIALSEVGSDSNSIYSNGTELSTDFSADDIPF